MNTERLNKMVNLVKNQTNYEEEEIKQMLIDNNYKYLEVIKKYLGINKENSSYEKYNSVNEDSSVNQKIYTNIRTFMDNNIKQYELRKQIEEQSISLNKNKIVKDDIVVTEK